MNSNLKKWGLRAAIAAFAAWVGAVSWHDCRPTASSSARRLSGADPMVLTGGGGLFKVNAGSGLSGSGTPANALVVNAGSGLTADATNVRANLGTGLTFSSGAIVPNLPAATCSNDQGITALDAAGTGTCGNVGRNAYGGTHFEWADDFLQGGTDTVTATYTSWGMVPFGAIQSGTGVSVGGTAGTTTRPGITEQNTGTTTTGRTALLLNSQLVDFGSGNWTYEWIGGFPTLSDVGTPTDAYAYVAGFHDSSSAVDTTDGCYFLYDSQNVATSGPNTGKAQKLSCWCSSNSVRTTYLMDGTTVSDESFTTVNAPVAALTLPNTNIYHLKVVMTGTTRAEFFVNGTKSCDINTHIPSGSTRLTGVNTMIIKNTGTTARTADIDWIRIAVDLTSARSP